MSSKGECYCRMTAEEAPHLATFFKGVVIEDGEKGRLAELDHQTGFSICSLLIPQILDSVNGQSVDCVGRDNSACPLNKKH